MYVTSANECYALDAGSGREIRIRNDRAPQRDCWWAQEARTAGPRWFGDRVFMEAEDAHLLALDRFSGQADLAGTDCGLAAELRNEFCTTGGGEMWWSPCVSGGEHGAAGYVVAFDQTSGKELWRFRTVPKRGEPGSETWDGKDIDHGGAPTWFTGTYDPAAREPCSGRWGIRARSITVTIGRATICIPTASLALDAHTGKLKWYFQFIRMTVWDYDSTETPVLNGCCSGKARRGSCCCMPIRSRILYLFDRTDGKLFARETLRAQSDPGHRAYSREVGADPESRR